MVDENDKIAHLISIKGVLQIPKSDRSDESADYATMCIFCETLFRTTTTTKPRFRSSKTGHVFRNTAQSISHHHPLIDIVESSCPE